MIVDESSPPLLSVPMFPLIGIRQRIASSKAALYSSTQLGSRLVVHGGSSRHRW